MRYGADTHSSFLYFHLFSFSCWNNKSVFIAVAFLASTHLPIACTVSIRTMPGVGSSGLET